MGKPDLRFRKELEKYGAVDFSACYNCGTCTAVCSLSTEKDSFPREMVRCSTLGINEDIDHSLKPWLCYYCGECTTYCPMEAKPGELMMSLRRYLISRYDWTSLSGMFYRNLPAYVLAFVLVILAIAGIYVYGIHSHDEWLHLGHYFEMIAIAAVAVIILLPNIFRMWLLTVLPTKNKFSLKAYLAGLKDLFIHMFTQQRSLDCEKTLANRIWWFEHFILVASYLLLLVTTVFLDWFATDSMLIIVMGYLFSAVIFSVTFDFVIRRFRKRTEKSTYSHPSDWFFVIWLFLMGLSAFTVRLFIDSGLLDNHFWLYLIHLTILTQWAVIIVPFGKWTHFLYRSFAMCFAKINSLSVIK